jgi:hypothetical protein
MTSGGRYLDSPDDEEDVRIKAFALLNRIGPADDDDETTWPENPQLRLSSYQRNENKKARKDDPRGPAQTHCADKNDYYEEWGMAGLLVSCIADACKKSTEYAARIGYETIHPDTRGAGDDFERVNILGTYQSASSQSSGEDLNYSR